MKRTRFSEEQIIGVVKEGEAGAKTADLARRHGVSEATIYDWEGKYRGLGGLRGEAASSARGREREAQAAAGGCPNPVPHMLFDWTSGPTRALLSACRDPCTGA
jgi:putative transposase